MGIEPTSSAWKAEVLPLNYTRKPRLPQPSRSPPARAGAAQTFLIPQTAHQARSWWRGEDSNLRRHKPADLQSAPVGRLGTPPRIKPTIVVAGISAVNMEGGQTG